MEAGPPPKTCKLARHEELRQLVAARLSDNCSPEQIAGWLKHTYPGDEAHQVSHETIYRSLFVQALGVLKKRLAPSPRVLTGDPSRYQELSHGDNHCDL